MKAMVFRTYGPPEVLHMEELETPVPQADEVLIQVKAAALNAADWHMVRADPFLVRFVSGLSKPRKIIPGADVAGTVVSAGSAVSRFKVGDAVFGDLFACGWGAFAEFATAREDALELVPDGISFEQAAAAPLAAVTALQALRDTGGIRAGQKVLINGASGGVGSFAVQLARHFGAEVTAVCSSAKLEQARSLGAHQVIDYTREDFSRTGRRWDLILGANGFQPLSAYKRALAPGGRYVMVGGNGKQMFQALLLGPWFSLFGKRKLGSHAAQPKLADLKTIRDLLAAGSLVPVIDRTYPLARLPDAMRYLEEGHAKGKIIVIPDR